MKQLIFEYKWILITTALLAAVMFQDYIVQPRFANKSPKIDENVKRLQNQTFERHCSPENYDRDLELHAINPSLFCTCKVDPIWKHGCTSKLELFSRKPFVLKIHQPFHDRAMEMSQYAEHVIMRPVMLGDEYGYSWVSPYINSEDGVISGQAPVVQDIYKKLSQITGLVYPCGGKPSASIVRYKNGGFVGLHYDASDLRLEQRFGFWLGAQIFRSAVGWLEDCRHFYTEYNIWKCLYLASRGKIEKSTSWNNYAYGPQVATMMVQLSELKGGETFFPKINLTVSTNKGDAVIWGNIDDNWQREPNSIHGGCPVLSEEKLIIVLFMPGKCNSFEAMTKNLLLNPKICN